jgi:hypothetical protein
VAKGVAGSRATPGYFLHEISVSDAAHVVLYRAPMASTDYDFEDVATLVADRRTLLSDDAPPALPFALKRRTADESAWLASLPQQTRAVLEAARTPAADWPRVPRVPGAIARPLHKIPSLRPSR